MSELNNLHPTLSPEELEDKIQKLVTELKARLFDITQENFKNPNCIDGRDLDNARPSIPGWGLGALGVILAYFDSKNSTLDRKQIIVSVKKYFWGNLTGHTQDHWEHTHNCQWCGHAHRLISEWDRYGLSDDSSALLKQESNNITSPDVLEWKHYERNVLIVDVPGKWIIARGEHGQDFVYNVWYAWELYTELTQTLEKEFWVEISLEEVLEIAESHFMTTGWDLAAGKDVFAITDVNLDDEPEVEYLMTVAA